MNQRNFLRRSILCLVVFMLLAGLNTVQGQPVVRWMQLIDGGRDFEDIFYDIFAIPGGGYALCGSSDLLQRGPKAVWLVVTDDDGAPLLNRTYVNEQQEIDWAQGNSLIKVDDGGYLIGGLQRPRGGNSRSRRFTLVKVNRNGDLEWWRTYEDDYGECFAVIELKAGNYLGSGRCIQNDQYFAYATLVNNNGDPIWANFYEGVWFHAIRETEGGLLFAGWGRDGGLLVKTDFEGEVLWEREWNSGQFFDLVSCPEGGFAACGCTGDFWLVRVNDEGHQMWNHSYDFTGGADVSWDVTSMEDGGFMLVGQIDAFIQDLPIRQGIIRTDNAGNLMWRRADLDLEGIELLIYRSSVLDSDGNTIVVGRGGLEGRLRGGDGFMIKFAPDRSSPTIISHIPEPLELTVLQGDSVLFAVHAEDLQEDSLSYLWTFEEDAFSVDTAAVIPFPNLGDFNVKCVVSDITGADSVQWLVHAVELYISDFTPDSLEMHVRRGVPVDFSATHRAVEGDPVNYLWTLTDLHTQRDTLLGEIDSVTAIFPKAHDYQVEAIAYRNQVLDAVQWLVHSCSTIWEWWPRELELTLPIEDTTEFSVWPFNPESDSLLMEWSLDGELFSDEWDVNVILNEIGDHEITVIVNDGCESDTLTWQVDAFDPDGVVGQAGMPTLPEALTLYPVFPNPFNSMTKLQIFISETDRISLSIHDLSGREITNIVNAIIPSGYYSYYWDAGAYPVGLYFARLSNGSSTRIRKLMLIK